MSKITPTRLMIDREVVDTIEGSPISIVIDRGMAPASVTFVVAMGGKTDKALRGKKNPVTIQVECAGLKTVDWDPIKLKNWHLIAERDRERGMVTYQLHDVRWPGARNYPKLTASYNIMSYAGHYRRETLKAGRRWFAYEAVQDALGKLGFTVTDNPDIGQDIKTVILPDNLGNSAGGGWVAADEAEAIPAMLEVIACDPVVMPDGSIQLQDRVTEYDKDLKDYAQAAGDVAEADIHWQKPKKLIVPFQKRFERVAIYQEQAGVTTSGAAAYDVELENVIPNYKQGDAQSLKDLTELMTYVATYFISVALIRARWFKRAMFDVLGNWSATTLSRYKVVQGLVRQCYRQLWRFKTPQAAAQAGLSSNFTRTHYSDLQLGRLQRDGTTRPGGVHMDYVRELRYGKLPRAKANPLEAEFTENVPYDADKPAPASAEWLPGHEGEVFQLVMAKPGFDANYTGYFPGLLLAPRGYGDFRKAAAGTAEFGLSETVGLSSNFTLKVFWNGLWVGDGAGYQARLQNLELPMFQDGDVESLTARCVMDITANYGVDYRNSFPGQLLNLDEMDARAEQVRHEIYASFDQGRAGIATQVGVAVLTKGKVWTKGNIHRVEIVLHARKPGSCETRITVLPGRRPEPPRDPITPRGGRRPQEVI